jgi:hypothetical protein
MTPIGKPKNFSVTPRSSLTKAGGRKAANGSKAYAESFLKYAGSVEDVTRSGAWTCRTACGTDELVDGWIASVTVNPRVAAFTDCSVPPKVPTAVAEMHGVILPQPVDPRTWILVGASVSVPFVLRMPRGTVTSATN